MKVILKDDMEKLGGFGDVVKVADGYARNYLIPKGLAVPATNGNVRQFEARKEAWGKKALRLREDAERLRGELEALTLGFSRKAGDDGRLFGSVTSMDMEASLKEKGYSIDRKLILLGEPIKTLGDFTVPLRLNREVKAGLRVSVVKEE